MIRRLLVANRGEIATRVIRACRELGVESVAVCTEADEGSPHVWLADRAIPIGPPGAYLDVGRLIDAAREAGADAVHPGYGFLAENPAFAAACEEAGLTFVGPSSQTIATLGDKAAARAIATRAGVPVVPGYSEPGASDDALAREAARVGFPLLIKASAGGGGRGMRIVRRPDDLAESLAAARREVRAAFGSDDLLLERYVEPARHVEIQILGDARGAAAHLGERECSVQRRHQKIVEESPSPAVTRDLRRRMGEAALALARAVGYRGAGTVEFVLDPDGRFYFLEVNARIQVEHPVTEMVAGVDLVREQIRIAAGEPLGAARDGVEPRGHAIECRVYAEDPARGFAPSPGRILRLALPSGAGVRVDAGVVEGQTVPPHYDPLLAKVIAWHGERSGAIERALAALRETVVLGPRTNVEFLRAVLDHPAFRAGDTTTDFVDRHLAGWSPDGDTSLAAAIAAALGAGPQGPAGRAAGPARAPDPWDRLGPWRLGGHER